uniref:Uncharacterized protein n=1 Tax=Ascaris lumbricoides TaxID=6252 RepID=A0A9J2PDB7_ASCLU
MRADDYRSVCFILCALLVCLLDFQWFDGDPQFLILLSALTHVQLRLILDNPEMWFDGDPQFLILLSALTHVQLRLILDNPEMINVEDLISCATLGESFIQCVEEGDFLDDQQATMVGRSCQECVSYVCEYLVECRKDETVELQSSAEIVLYRFICSYLAIGGHNTINSSLIDDVLLALVDIARRSCEHGDASVVEMLLPSLPNFNSLPSSCLDLIVSCLERQSSIGDCARLSAKVARVVDELKDRSNWYMEGSLTSAKQLAQKLGSRDLIEAFSALK